MKVVILGLGVNITKLLKCNTKELQIAGNGSGWKLLLCKIMMGKIVIKKILFVLPV